jgi:uncharacterized protein YcbX
MTATVATLWRYPVKSMLGEPCDEVELNTRGVRGDRQFAVRSADGKFGSGKNSRRFRHLEGLFSFRAQLAGDCPEITFPDGRRLRADDPAIDSTLSAVLGMPVTLARERDISHFDASPIHLVSTASLQWLRSRLPQSRVDERRFRPNITVSSDERELSWLGKTLCIGGVELRVTAPTGRCVMTTSAQTDLPFDPKILRCIAQEAGEDFGVYAEVLQAGRISRGDPVTLR